MSAKRTMMTLFVVNISPNEQKSKIEVLNDQVDRLLDRVVLSSTSIDAMNVLNEPEKNVVSTHLESVNRKIKELIFPAESIIVCRLQLR